MRKILSHRSFADRRVRCSLCCFFIAAMITAISFMLPASISGWAGHTFFVFLLCLLSLSGRDIWRYTLQATILGFMFTYCLLFAWRTFDRKLAIFSFYLTCLSTFHFLEFLFTAFTTLETLDHSSFLLDHSLMYWIAAVGSWVEFFVEYFLSPQLKISSISFVGLLMVITGEIFRKLAMVHAGGAFTHYVVRYKRPNHVLVTDGVYSVVRHPGYTGWFIWCIGTQVLLCNPICIVVYAISAWHFFKERIFDEERLLSQFFGEHYRTYQKAVPLGIPFVHGYCDP